MQLVEQRSLKISVGLHALVLFIALVGLPILLPARPDPTPLVMSVELLPISDVSNVKPSDQKIQKEQHAPTPKPAKPMPPSAPDKPKEAPPKPADAPKPKPVEEKHFDPTEGVKPDVEKTKPVEPPKEDSKAKEKPKPKAPDDFASLLNKLNQENQTAPVKDAKDKTNTEENKTKSDAPYDASKPLSISEKDAIRSQFIPCWRAPAGAKDAASLAVRVKVELLQDGTVQTATLATDQQSRYANDPYFRAAADSAVRAVHKCSPLKNLPPDKFGTWSTMEINFDPRDML